HRQERESASRPEHGASTGRGGPVPTAGYQQDSRRQNHSPKHARFRQYLKVVTVCVVIDRLRARVTVAWEDELESSDAGSGEREIPNDLDRLAPDCHSSAWLRNLTREKCVTTSKRPVSDPVHRNQDYRGQEGDHQRLLERPTLSELNETVANGGHQSQND